MAGCAAGVGDHRQCAPTFVHLCVELRFEQIFFFLISLRQKGLLIRLEKEESLAGRLATWLRSLVPTSAPPPKTTATDHFSFSVYRGVSLQVAATEADRTGSFVCILCDESQHSAWMFWEITLIHFTSTRQEN